jgi:HEAT repeat protein
MPRMMMFVLALASVSPAAAQQPQIQNGKVEVRKDTAIDRAIAGVPAGGPDQAAWVAWKVPMVDGDRDICSWYSDRSGTVRGTYLDQGVVTMVSDSLVSTPRPQIAAPTGPVPLEGGTHLVILARVIQGKVERLRMIGDDCPLDAGGRTVYWLDSVTPAESLRYLTTLVRAGAPDRAAFDQEQSHAQNALRAISYHRDSAADAALEQFATDPRDANVRRQATSYLGSMRGARGAATLAKFLAAEKDVDARRHLVAALGQSRDASAVETLRGLVRDPEVRVRAEAAYHYIVRGGAAALPEAQKLLASETVDSVRTRNVSAIGRLPPDTSIPALLQLARSDNAAVRKQATSALSQSKDPRAIAFMEQLLKR